MFPCEQLVQKKGTAFRQLLQSSGCYSKYDRAELEEPSPSLTSQLAAAMTDKRQQTGQKAGAGALERWSAGTVSVPTAGLGSTTGDMLGSK